MTEKHFNFTFKHVTHRILMRCNLSFNSDVQGAGTVLLNAVVWSGIKPLLEDGNGICGTSGTLKQVSLEHKEQVNTAHRHRLWFLSGPAHAGDRN